MKNLPDDELFKQIEYRLRNYEEVPDDGDWEKIAANIPPTQTTSMKWSDRAVLGLGLLLLTAFAVEQFMPGLTERKQRLSDTTQHRESGDDITTTEPGKRQKELTRSSQSLCMNRNASAYLDSGTLIQRRDGNGLSGNRLKEDTSAAQQSSSEAYISNATKVPNAHGTTNQQLPAGGLFAVDDQSMAEDVASSYQSHEEVNDMIAIDDSLSSRAAGTTQSETERPTETIDRPSPSEIHTVVALSHKSPPAFYFMATPSLGYEEIKPFANDNVIVLNVERPSITSFKRIGFAFETGFQGRLTPRLSYLAGLVYSNQSVDITYVRQNTTPQVEDSGNLSYTFKPSIIREHLTFSMRNVGVRAGLMYTLSTHKIAHGIGTSVQYEIGLNKLDQEGESTTPHYLNLQVFYRVEFPISKRLTFFMQPSYLRSISAEHRSDAPFEIRQSRAAVGFGVYLYLNR